MDVNGAIWLHEAAWYDLVDSVQQLIKAGCKKLLFDTNKKGQSVLHYTSDENRVQVAWLLIEAGGKKLLLMTDNKWFSVLGGKELLFKSDLKVSQRFTWLHSTVMKESQRMLWKREARSLCFL